MNERGPIKYLGGAEQTVWQENTRGRKMHLPITMSNKTQQIWRVVIRSEAYNILSQKQKDDLFGYMFTDSTIAENAEKLKISEKTHISRLKASMIKMRESKSELYERFTIDEIKKLKDRKKSQRRSKTAEKKSKSTAEAFARIFRTRAESKDSDLSKSFRHAQPEKAAAFNLMYVSGPNFPRDTRNAYIRNNQLYAEIATKINGIKKKILYVGGTFYHDDNSVLSVLSPEEFKKIYTAAQALPREQRDYLLQFARMTKVEIRRWLIDNIKVRRTLGTQLKNGKANGNGK